MLLLLFLFSGWIAGLEGDGRHIQSVKIDAQIGRWDTGRETRDSVNFLKKNEITIPNLQSRKAKEPTYELNGCETL